MTTPENPRVEGIARFGVVALDCPDAVALARFYSALTGWPPTRPYDSDGWIQLDPPDGHGASLAFQKVSSGYRPAGVARPGLAPAAAHRFRGARPGRG